MKSKEIQEKLDINADRIKLFKREGIFTPENPPSGNCSTEYTRLDYEKLKLIVVLTKMGLTCRDIYKIFQREITLLEACKNRLSLMSEDIKRKQHASTLLREVIKAKEESETFRTDHYWDVISKKESEGEKFIEFDFADVKDQILAAQENEDPHSTFFNQKQIISFTTGIYVCDKCGEQMYFVDDNDRDTLVCSKCGYITDLDHYGFTDEEYENLYKLSEENVC